MAAAEQVRPGRALWRRPRLGARNVATDTPHALRYTRPIYSVCDNQPPANMSRLQVVISHVDGSRSEWHEPPSLLGRMRSLQRDGYTGKRLIDRLLTDDWGPPPSVVRITGRVDGVTINEVIQYT